MQKFVMILGASLLQGPAVLAAKDMGFKVCVVGNEMHPSMEGLADEFRKIDLKDLDALADFALSRRGDLAAVFTSGTDFAVSVSYVAEKCGLPSHSFEAAQNACNKIRMRECFRRFGVSSPGFIPVDCEKLSAIKYQIEKSDASVGSLFSPTLSFPMVVKPADNMGARGCRKVFNPQELIAACESAMAFSRTSTAIVEEFMDGPEFSLDGIIFDGKMIVTGFADRHIFFPPYFVELGHTMPSDLPLEIQFDICREFKKASDALGLSCGAAKGDIKFTVNGVKIGEVAGRLSGGYMSGWTFPYASGFNLTKAALEIACGKKPHLFNEENLSKMVQISPDLYLFPCEKYSSERAFISIPGVVKSIYGQPKGENPNVKDFFLRVQPGDAVCFPTNNVEKCGNVISLAETVEESIAAAEEVVQNIILELEYPNEETEKFLSENLLFPPSSFAFSADNLTDVSSETIDTRTPIFAKLPKFLQEHIGRDFGGRTVGESIFLFETFCHSQGVHSEIPLKEFCRAFCRGSIQGVLYLAQKYKVD